MKTLAYMHTHIINEGLISELRKIKKAQNEDLEVILFINNTEIFIKNTKRQVIQELEFYGLKVKCLLCDKKIIKTLKLPLNAYYSQNVSIGECFWFNCDYSFYIVRHFFADFDFYWQIQYDVFYNDRDYVSFFNLYSNNKNDLLITKFRKESVESDWCWINDTEWIYTRNEIYGSLWTVARMSANLNPIKKCKIQKKGGIIMINKRQINILIPMAGRGERFAKVGFTKPKPFIEVGKTTKIPMIERVLQNLCMVGAKVILVALKEHLARESKLVERIKREYGAEFIGIENLTQGTACTLLYASGFIDNDMPLLIANTDQIVDIDINEFCADCFRRGLDGSILCFVDKERNPKWSFVRLDERGFVREVREKQPISEYATSGIYLFSQGKVFVQSAQEMIVRDERVNGEFYTAPSYNYAIANGAKIGIYKIAQERMHGLGTPQDLAEYERFLESKK